MKSLLTLLCLGLACQAELPRLQLPEGRTFPPNDYSQILTNPGYTPERFEAQNFDLMNVEVADCSAMGWTDPNGDPIWVEMEYSITNLKHSVNGTLVHIQSSTDDQNWQDEHFIVRFWESGPSRENITSCIRELYDSRTNCFQMDFMSMGEMTDFTWIDCSWRTFFALGRGNRFFRMEALPTALPCAVKVYNTDTNGLTFSTNEFGVISATKDIYHPQPQNPVLVVVVIIVVLILLVFGWVIIQRCLSHNWIPSDKNPNNPMYDSRYRDGGTGMA